MSVIEEIAAERRRQIEAEGWTPEHDDAYHKGELAGAAACYAMHGLEYRISIVNLAQQVSNLTRDLWPWARSWWKPKDRRRDLIRSAALLVAEIERLDRASRPS